MAGKKDATVTFHPAEGVWRDDAGKEVKRDAPVSNLTPAFSAPTTAPADANAAPPSPSVPSGT